MDTECDRMDASELRVHFRTPKVLCVRFRTHDASGIMCSDLECLKMRGCKIDVKMRE